MKAACALVSLGLVMGSTAPSWAQQNAPSATSTASDTPAPAKPRATKKAGAKEAKAPAAEPPPRRSLPVAIVGASGFFAGLTTLAVSGIVAAITPCVTFPGLPSGCDPTFDNTYVAPLILAGGVLTVISIPVLSIGLERDVGPLQFARGPKLEISPHGARLVTSF